MLDANCTESNRLGEALATGTPIALEIVTGTPIALEIVTGSRGSYTHTITVTAGDEILESVVERSALPDHRAELVKDLMVRAATTLAARPAPSQNVTDSRRASCAPRATRSAGHARPRERRATRTARSSSPAASDDPGGPRPACAASNLRLDHAELGTETVDWTFRVTRDGQPLWIHATTSDLDAWIILCWHTDVDGLHVSELADVDPADFAIGLPADVSREALEERIAEEQARQALASQFALQALDRREARNARRTAARRRGLAA